MSDNRNENEIYELSKVLLESDKKILLIYGFNGTGKTRLSVTYKEVAKGCNEGRQAGVYYNAFSEDLFIWDNDIENNEQDIELVVKESSLNQYHSLITEEDVRNKLSPYNMQFEFYFAQNPNPEDGIRSISFYKRNGDDVDEEHKIKISRGEERVFVWCFFLSLFDANGWIEKQSNHIFIDDPVSSMDEHNIYITASTILNLIEKHSGQRKIIITTHHIGLFSILNNWLLKGEKSKKYETDTSVLILRRLGDSISLLSPKHQVFLYHLFLMKELVRASKDGLGVYHFASLRQLLENIASFLGVGQFGYVLEQIGIEDPGRVASIINSHSHQDSYHFQSQELSPSDELLFKEVLERLLDRYKFVLHDGADGR
jgi:wobble nucleotide-excising tRNase